jgi:hypothetical protein
LSSERLPIMIKPNIGATAEYGCCLDAQRQLKIDLE